MPWFVWGFFNIYFHKINHWGHFKLNVGTPILRTLWTAFLAIWTRYRMGEVKREIGKIAIFFSLQKYASKDFTLVSENREIQFKAINQN